MNFLNSLYNNLLLMRVDILVFHSEMDTARPWQYSFSDPATPIMEGIINFHNDLNDFFFFFSEETAKNIFCSF